MDPELPAYLDTMREDLVQRIVASNVETREELTDRMLAMNTETREQFAAHIHAMRSELTAHMVTLSAENRAHAEGLHAKAIAHAKELHTQARVLIEAEGQKVQLVWEGVQGIKETLDSKLDDHEQRIQRLERGTR